MKAQALQSQRGLKGLTHACFKALLSFCFGLAGLAATGLDALAQDSPELEQALKQRWQRQARPALWAAPLVPLKGRFELSLSLGYVPNDDFYNSFPIQLDFGYHWNETLRLGLRSALTMLHRRTELARFLQEKQSPLDLRSLAAESLAHFDLLIHYHPLYGKWNFGGHSLGRVDWGLLAGLGLHLVRSHERDKVQYLPKAQGLIGSQLRFFFQPWLALKLETTLRLYRDREHFVLPVDLSAALTILLPK